MKLAVSTLISYREREVDLGRIVEENPEIKRWEILDEGFNRLSPKQIRSLKEGSSVNDVRFSVHAPLSSINIAEGLNEIRKFFVNHLKTSLMNAYKIGAEAVVTHSGHFSPFTIHFPEIARKSAIKSLGELLILAEDLSISLFTENLPVEYALASTLERTLALFDGLDGKIGLALDIGHANIFDGAEEFIEAMSSRIGYIHAHDNNGDKDSHLPVGEGTVNWGQVATLMKRIGYDGWVVAENYTLEDSKLSLRRLENLL